MWQHPTFRRSQRALTLLWGAAFVTEAALRALLTHLLPISAMNVINNMLPSAVIAGLIFGSVRYGRRVASAPQRLHLKAGTI